MAAPRAVAKRPLTRERVLTAALRLVDDEGLDALTMRALGKRLGVEAMSLYNHVPGKRGLRDGIGELLWSELEHADEPGGDWRGSVRALATGVRQLARDHPHAYPLLLARRVTPAPGLRIFATQLDALQLAGYEQARAADALRAVVGYAIGFAMLELSVLSQAEDPSVPADTPPDLVEVARVVCLCDMERQFEVGLDALLAGLER